MIALFRYIVELFKKERKLLQRYDRTHPHFLWFVLIDGAISVSLVFGGFAIVRTLVGPSRAHIQIEDAGGVPLSTERLIRHFQGEKRVAYWLGPKDSNSYTPTGVEKDNVTVTYLDGGAVSLSTINEPKLTVRTFDNRKSFEAHDPHSVSIYRTSTWNAHGDEVSYDTHRMNSVVVRFKNKVQVVQIDYPKLHSASFMLTDSIALRRVW